MALRKTKEPGVFYDDVLGKFLKIVEWSRGDRYDTNAQSSGAVTAGTTLTYFRSLTDKSEVDGNFPAARRVLSNGEEMILERIGVHIPAVYRGNTVTLPRDVKKTAERNYLTVKLDRKLIADGPLFTFPSGYGYSGQTTENDAGVISIGVPSQMAAPKLTRPHELNQDTDVDVQTVWQNNTWDSAGMPTLDNGVYIQVHLIGLLKSAATRAG